MIAASDDLDGLFKTFVAGQCPSGWRDLVKRAERERWSCQDFLMTLVAEEIAHRQQNRRARLKRCAHFPPNLNSNPSESAITRPRKT